ncbi:hypothetical protein F4803DRAFT_43935 [Xylaria telfairii]|nr:hypothetical protein F4803DRAFT_43935 [Xylaria telfairii]
MFKTYAIINQIASPEELQIIAFGYKNQNQYRYASGGREPSVAPSYIKRPRSSSRATTVNLRTTRVPANSETHSLSGPRYRNPSPSQPLVMGTSRARSPRSVAPQPLNRAAINGHTNVSDIHMASQPSNPHPASRAHKPPERFSTLIDDTKQHEYDPMNSNMDDTSPKTPPPLAPVNSVAPNGYATDTKETAQVTPESPPRCAVSDTEVTKTDNIAVKLLSPSPLQDCAPNITQLIEQPQSKRSLEKSNAGNVSISVDIAKKDLGSTEVQILPYVLYEGGAYQLPVSLGLEMKSKLQGSLSFGHSRKQLTERLAFLSPSQVQTLQNLLQHNSGDQVRKLAHLEVVRKSSMKFWQKSTKVMIAFVEGETSAMPEGIPLAATDPTGTGSKADSRLSRKTHFGVPRQHASAPGFNNDSSLKASDAEGSRTGQAEPASIPQIQVVRRQNDITHTTSTAPASAPPGQLNNLNIAGISGIQDITALLVTDEEWRKRFAEYKVWTIQPLSGIGQAQTPDDAWDRCEISEEHFSIPEIRRRLTSLDKNTMTVLQKMTMLTVSQQIQVQQSLETAKSGASDFANEWKFRQLDIIRSKKLFRPKHVKKVVVYVCVEPFPHVFKQPEESQKQHLEDAEDGPSDLAYNKDRLATAKRGLIIEDKINHSKKRPRNMTSRCSEDTLSTENSEWETRAHKEENDLREEIRETGGSNGRRESRDSTRREIERANEAIANRPPVPSESRGRSRPAFSRLSSESARTHSPTRLSSLQLASLTSRDPTQPIIINNRIYNSRRDFDSTSEGDSSNVDEYEVRHSHPIVKITTRHESARGGANDHRPTDYDDGHPDVHSDDEDRLAVQVHEREADPEYEIHRPRRSVEPQGDRTPYAGTRVAIDHNNDLELRLSSLPRSPYSAGPRDRSRSVATSISRPRLLGYYTDEELKARARERATYPDEFDRQPYDPQLSPQAVEARQEAIEQLLLEWTPLYKTEYDSDNDEADSEDPEENGSSPASLNGQSHSTVVVTEEPETLHYVPRSKDATPPAETGVDMLSSELSENQDQETRTVKEHGPRVRIDSVSGTTASQPPFAGLQRRETTGGINPVKPINGQLSNRAHPQTPDGNDDDDAGFRPLHKGNRAATLPTPARQTWADIDWARQIVEETAIVADPDEYEPSTVRVLERELLPRGRGRRRDTERWRSPLARRQPRDRSRADGSFERRPSPPPRRRTVEFEGLTERHVGSRERHRGPEPSVGGRDHISEPRQRRRSRTQARDRGPRTETYSERTGYHRSKSGSKPRDDRHSSRR